MSQVGRPEATAKLDKTFVKFFPFTHSLVSATYCPYIGVQFVALYLNF